jgi:hypothetical protein
MGIGGESKLFKVNQGKAESLFRIETDTLFDQDTSEFKLKYAEFVSHNMLISGAAMMAFVDLYEKQIRNLVHIKIESILASIEQGSKSRNEIKREIEGQLNRFLSSQTQSRRNKLKNLLDNSLDSPLVTRSVLGKFESKISKIRSIGFDKISVGLPSEARHDNDTISPLENSREVFFPKGSQHDAYTTIREILISANESIMIVDSYVDGSIFKTLKVCKPNLSIFILSNRIQSDFNLELSKFGEQYNFQKLSIRKSREFHDRFIIIDDKQYYHLGASIKDTGQRASMLNLVEDPLNIEAVKTQATESWENGTIIRT